MLLLLSRSDKEEDDDDSNWQPMPRMPIRRPHDGSPDGEHLAPPTGSIVGALEEDREQHWQDDNNNNASRVGRPNLASLWPPGRMRNETIGRPTLTRLREAKQNIDTSLWAPAKIGEDRRGSARVDEERRLSQADCADYYYHYFCNLFAVDVAVVSDTREAHRKPCLGPSPPEQIHEFH